MDILERSMKQYTESIVGKVWEREMIKEIE